MVAQIDEQQAAMVADAVAPARQAALRGRYRPRAARRRYGCDSGACKGVHVVSAGYVSKRMSRGKAHAGARLSRSAKTCGQSALDTLPPICTLGASLPLESPRLDDRRNDTGSADRSQGRAQARNRGRDRDHVMTTAEATVAALVAHGLDTIYALPGVHNDLLFDALFKASDRIRTVHTRHEQGAAYMALGAALATGRPQAYAVVPGPGLLNSAAALLTAYGTNAPVLALIGHIPAGRHRPQARPSA